MRLAWLVALLSAATACLAHDGPDPIYKWEFHPRNLSENVLEAILGPNATVQGNPRPVRDVTGQSIFFDGRDDVLQLPAPDLSSLPKAEFTVEAWVSIETPQNYGGILGAFQDNSGYEKGWILGYNDRTFTFGLSSTGADDGDGAMTYLAGSTPYEIGKLYHVVATFDGSEMRLYVNGKFDASSTAQSGEVLYPTDAPWSLGRYHDADGDFRHRGRLVEVALYDLIATEDGVEHLFEHHADWAAADVLEAQSGELKFLVEPYLQFPGRTEMTVMWETSVPSTSVVHFGPSQDQLAQAEGESALIHRVTLTELRPDSHYVFFVESMDESGNRIETDLLTFRTAPEKGQPIRFCVVGDTQDQPHVNTRIAEHMWNERPDFFLIPGDLVGTGANKDHWTQHFFGSMRPLLSRVPLLPVLGNHEGDARLYYDYMAVPDPEYYYSFIYGDIEIFVIDSNRNVAPGSEQYQWLEEALAKSTAKWKFATHHHPPFSSDEDDFGNLWRGQSTRGDVRLRALAPLYEKYKVDIVWTGHIHSYERTWPMVEGAAEEGGPIYVVCGGGGGGLETHGPTRPAFSNVVRHGHHYVVVSIFGDTLEARAFDIEGRLFDTFQIKKEN